jgi:hypothetical protein
MTGEPQPNNRRDRRNLSQALAKEIMRDGVPKERSASREIALAIIPAAVLYLIQEAGKNSPPVTVFFLALCAVILLRATYRAKWVIEAKSKKKRNVKYGVCAVAILIIVALFGGWVWPTRTVDETTIKTWMDDAKWHYETVPTDSQEVKDDTGGPALFSYVLTPPNGHRLFLFRGRLRPALLQVKAFVEASDGQLQKFHTLTADQGMDVAEEVQNKLSGTLTDTGFRWRFEPKGAMPSQLTRIGIEIEKYAPVQELTEVKLVDLVSAVDKGDHFAVTTLDLTIKNATKER